MESVSGRPYPFAGGRDGAAAKSVAANPDYDPDELERRLRLMLSSQFWAESGVDFPKFAKQWAALSNAGRVGSRAAKPIKSNADLAIEDFERRGGSFVGAAFGDEPKKIGSGA